MQCYLAKSKHCKKCLKTVNLKLKAAKSKIWNYVIEISPMRIEVKELSEKLKDVKSFQ